MAVKEVETKKSKGFRAILPAYEADERTTELDGLRRAAQSELTLQTRRDFRRNRRQTPKNQGLGPDMDQPPLITT